MFGLMPSCGMPMALKCSHHEVSAPTSEMAKAMWSSAPGAPAVPPGGKHNPEAPGRGLEGDVTPGLAAQLGEAQRTLVPGHAGVEVGHAQLHVGQTFEGW